MYPLCCPHQKHGPQSGFILTMIALATMGFSVSCSNNEPPSDHGSTRITAQVSSKTQSPEPQTPNAHQPNTEIVPVPSAVTSPPLSDATSAGPSSMDALTAALENDDRDPERQQHAAGMLRTSTGADVTLHTLFEAGAATKGPGSAITYVPGPIVLSVPSPTLVQEILDWTHHRHHSHHTSMWESRQGQSG